MAIGYCSSSWIKHVPKLSESVQIWTDAYIIIQIYYDAMKTLSEIGGLRLTASKS